MSDQEHEPRHVVLTGGAGALGWAVAQHFFAEGARIAFIVHRVESHALAFPGLDVVRHPVVQADVGCAAEVARAAAQIRHVFPSVDALIHVAGGFEAGQAVHTIDRAAWERMMDLNAWSFVALAQAFVPPMIVRGKGRIVAVSARSAAHGVAAMGAYCASKSALQRLVEAMAAELAPHGIAVNSIAPGVLDTQANRQAMPHADPRQWVSVHDAAAAISLLASDAAIALQGQHLVLGGGV